MPFQPQPTDTLYDSYDRALNKLTGSEQADMVMQSLNADSRADNSSAVQVAADTIGSGVDTSTTASASGSYQAGKQTFDNTTTGFILGLDPKDGFAKFYIGNPTSYLNWTGTALNIAGTITASSIDIPDTTTANSFHVDSSGNTWWGATTLAGATTANITKAGAATFTSITINGRAGSNLAAAINSSSNLITDIINARLDSSAKTFLAAFNFGSADYAGAVNAGTITWNTTTGAITGGSGVILYRGGILGVAAGVTTFFIDPTTGSATFSGTITSSAGTIGGFTLTSTQLQATNFSVTSGAANTARIEVGTGANTGGINSPNAGSDISFWSGSTFANRATAPFRVDAAGNLTATSATVSGYAVSTGGTFGGTGTDGALSLSSGTTTINCAGAQLVIKNYTSISITGTGKLAFSNPHANGTIVILKSQGAVVLTSSTVPCVDMSAMGAAAGVGAANSSGTAGTAGTMQIYSTGGGGGGVIATSVGAAGAAIAFSYQSTLYETLFRYPTAFVGAGGGGGSAASGAGGTGGNGGKGGGGLLIECAGDLNFTGTTSTAGAAGSNGQLSGGQDGAGGGGGGGGITVILYKTATATSGTMTVSGGAGGNSNGAPYTGNTVYGGGGGGSKSAGTAGTSANTVSANTGGAGANGISLIATNTVFA